MNLFVSIWRTLWLLCISSVLIFAGLTAITSFSLALYTAMNM